MKWDKESTLKLIEMYEAHPELWNCILKEYRDRDKKAQAIKNIDQLKTTEAEVGRKWHNLRCQMNSEIRKIKKTKSGDGTDDRLWKSKWEFYDALQFMMGYSGSTKSTTNFRDTVSSQEEDFLEESQLQGIEKPTTSNTTTHRSKKLKTKAKEKTDEEVFIYSMPGYSCPIKERMLYSSCKNPLTDTITILGLEIAKKLEIDSGDELTEKNLYDEVHPITNLHRPKFAKPKGPANRGPKRITKNQ
ncbi:unnamed protein product [Acanthoscelides obtectus]|uniref:MADF domain-containing protein n=1 Tax=Acanthoscelides obtectus TaxID=200917 RepID=A0A9P0KAA9_ACAOB|nr:unnamed protein product [Acanthoscelides obtectus]CAK1623040.1 Twinfilin [Acanthoscelides obtectus]